MPAICMRTILTRQSINILIGAVRIPFGFEVLELHRIQAMVNPDNPASSRVLKKVGFMEEGRLRAYEYHYVRKDFNDVIMLSLLRQEYGQEV